MFKFRTRGATDDARIVVRVDADRDANASIDLGKVSKRAQQDVRFRARGRNSGPEESVWPRGLFFICAFALVVGVFVFVEAKYSLGAAWASLAGSILVVYLLGLILVPGTLTEDGFLSVVKALFLKK